MTNTGTFQAKTFHSGPITSTSVQRLYQEVILEHSRKRGKPLVDTAHGQSQQTNPLCGDEVTIQLLVGADSVIEQVRWDGRGCAVSQASASLFAQFAPGLALEVLGQRITEFHDALRSRGQNPLPEEHFEDAVALGLLSTNVARVKCAILGWTAAEHALAQITSQN